MFVDTHCHINMMVKKEFDVLLQPHEIMLAQKIILQAQEARVVTIINVGTSLIESQNCVTLTEQFNGVYAAIGIHPNDCTATWKTDLETMIDKWFKKNRFAKIVAIGECGLDRHYPDFNLPRQIDAFKAQIELALEYSLPIIVHTRDAAQETLDVLQQYKNDSLKGIIHCFSENIDFARQVIQLGFHIGIGGIITYPKNEYLRDVVRSMPLESIVLETDAPFLPVQNMRGKQNNPQYIPQITEYIAELKHESLETVAKKTTENAMNLFKI